MTYSTQEHTKLVMIYLKKNSLQKTANAFYMKYPNKSKPHLLTIKNLISKFTKTGSVPDYHCPGHLISVTNSDNQEAIVAILQENPQQSTHKLAKKINISPFSGYFKTEVFKTSPFDIEDLKQQIVNEYDKITSEPLLNIRHTFLNHLKYCSEFDGQHFEHLI
ncbi:7655_t:CDS:2 [Dentiscutata heterogama]|uniref:7655_t:CDS:1 n=1 Tax=Dentiscutata heterogama TaxID=1316150 RepID=A0ACA9KNM2_9GLOM|nr:7655_t:CDS:2 [Dentiscutata heterogama]